MLDLKKLSQLQKGFFILIITGILVYLSAQFLSSALFRIYLGLPLEFTEPTDIEFSFGILTTPAFFLSFFFVFIKEENSAVRKTLGIIILLVIILNTLFGILNLIFSAVFIALGYTLAKLIRWLISSRAKA